MSKRRGLLIILSSPSGAGKSTLSKRLIAWDPTLSFSISATTRKPRADEIDGVDYYFLSRSNFIEMAKSGDLLEFAEVFGNSYGSPKKPIELALEAGRDVLFDIDWQGAKQIQNSQLGPDALAIFILPPSIAELERRLRYRGQDSDAEIKMRMAKSEAEISHWEDYDYVLINDELKDAERRLIDIVSTSRMRRRQQPNLAKQVRALSLEFKQRS